MAAIVSLAALAAACGSVGDKTDGGKGGSGGSAAGGSGGSAAGGSGGGGGSAAGGSGGSAADASVDAPTGAGGTPGDASTDGTTTSDAATDGPPPLASCQAIKQQNPTATSDVYTIAPPGFPARSVFCEMTLDGGGWTAFYIGDNGSTPGGLHFEMTADSCPDVRNRCIRRVPASVTLATDFAVKCGAAVVKFKLGSAPGLGYFRDGVQAAWQPLSGAIAIDAGLVGKGNLVGALWTGAGATDNPGWIIAGPGPTPTGQPPTNTTFANGYTMNTGWNFCNGAPDGTMRVMLFYR